MENQARRRGLAARGGVIKQPRHAHWAIGVSRRRTHLRESVGDGRVELAMTTDVVAFFFVSRSCCLVAAHPPPQ